METPWIGIALAAALIALTSPKVTANQLTRAQLAPSKCLIALRSQTPFDSLPIPIQKLVKHLQAKGAAQLALNATQSFSRLTNKDTKDIQSWPELRQKIYYLSFLDLPIEIVAEALQTTSSQVQTELSLMSKMPLNKGRFQQDVRERAKELVGAFPQVTFDNSDHWLSMDPSTDGDLRVGALALNRLLSYPVREGWLLHFVFHIPVWIISRFHPNQGLDSAIEAVDWEHLIEVARPIAQQEQRLQDGSFQQIQTRAHELFEFIMIVWNRYQHSQINALAQTIEPLPPTASASSEIVRQKVNSMSPEDRMLWMARYVWNISEKKLPNHLSILPSRARLRLAALRKTFLLPPLPHDFADQIPATIALISVE